MATSNQIDVAGNAVLVVPASQDRPPTGAQRFSGPSRVITMKNIGPAVAYIGGSNVTSDIGIPIGSGGAFTFWLSGADELWAVTAGNAAVVSYLETGGQP